MIVLLAFDDSLKAASRGRRMTVTVWCASEMLESGIEVHAMRFMKRGRGRC